MRATAFGCELKPEVAFVGGDDFQLRGLADDGQIRFQTRFSEGARTSLAILLVNQPQENNFGIVGPTPAMVREFAEMGYDYVAIASDMGMAMRQANAFIAEFDQVKANANAGGPY